MPYRPKERRYLKCPSRTRALPDDQTDEAYPRRIDRSLEFRVDTFKTAFRCITRNILEFAPFVARGARIRRHLRLECVAALTAFPVWCLGDTRTGLHYHRLLSLLACSSNAIFGNRTGPRERTEHFFARAAQGTLPVIRQVLKPRSLGNLSLSVASIGIVNIPAVWGLALPHFLGIPHAFSFHSCRTYQLLPFQGFFHLFVKCGVHAFHKP